MRISLAEPTRLRRLLAQRYNLPDFPEVGGISSDSREVEPGDLFVPIVGSRVDGHDFIPPAVAAGAVAVMAERDVPALQARFPLIRVPGTVSELGSLARSWLDEFDLPVVAITGSNGKTTTKNLAVAVLTQRYQVLGTQGSYNSTIGLPLTVLRLGAGDELAVLEMGSNHPGEINYLAALATPRVGLITNISATHVAYLEDKAGVVREKGALFQALPPDGTAVVNLDDPAVAAIPSPARRFTYGTTTAADVTGEYALGTSGGILTLDGGLEIRLPQPGAQLAQNALAAAALGLLLDVPPESIKSAIESFTLPPGRGEILRFNGITVIDDSYNANLASTLAGLETLLQLPSAGRRIAVLGDMQELGRFSEEYHRQVGTFAADLGIDALLCYGPETRETTSSALSSGLDARHFTDRSDLAHVLSRSVDTGDVIYVKGSRGMAMEVVIAEAFQR